MYKITVGFAFAVVGIGLLVSMAASLFVTRPGRETRAEGDSR